MFGHEVASLAAIVGQLRVICDYKLKAPDQDRALGLLEEAERILTSPNGDSDQRERWREQKRAQRGRSSVSADVRELSADMSAERVVEEVVVVEEEVAQPEGEVVEEPRTPAPPREKKPRSTWLTPIANRLDEMGFTLPAKGSREAKAFYGAMTGELERVFKGNGGTDRDKFVAFVVWVLENALGERVASKFEGNPVPAVSYIVAVVAKPETLERYKRAIAPPATPADVERWAAENKRKIDEAMAAGAYGPQP